MVKEFLTSWEQITLSPEADRRIRAALAAAQSGAHSVIPLPTGGRAKKHVRNTARGVLIAAVTACLLSVTVLAVGIGHIILVERQTQAANIETGQTEPLVEVYFEPTSDCSALMGVWKMEALPEGCVETDSFYTLGWSTQMWQMPGGGQFSLQYTAGREADRFGMTLPDEADMESRTVSVNGGEGRLYTSPGTQMLFWTDEERGVGFMLSARDGAEDMDLVALAESVVLTDETPEASGDTRAAIAELGDWAPAALPEGYSAYFDQGTPGASYGGTYSYVRRFYSNAAGHTIELRYETPVNPSYDGYVANYRSGFERPADQPDAVCTVTDTTVQGLPAGLIEYPDGTPLRLVWLAEDGTVAFLLRADDLTSEELMAVADSVARGVAGKGPGGQENAEPG